MSDRKPLEKICVDYSSPEAIKLKTRVQELESNIRGADITVKRLEAKVQELEDYCTASKQLLEITLHSEKALQDEVQELKAQLQAISDKDVEALLSQIGETLNSVKAEGIKEQADKLTTTTLMNACVVDEWSNGYMQCLTDLLKQADKLREGEDVQ